ncbi:class I SAM-dependent methyltransferase [Paracrocinitomix mangrovi]|uniref:class I SAM-dependent methyltransferase n=1 Tax=Paracrocinitomix mangrovi TaxID=2862509 RepID=UPI001C8EEA29|nr:class I SAM-dependent methyltransferase [Paracrocinitomix mangrovi]UKN01495.1 class I SAM-dependent methyltransferase [Paracrocinitomix mangrovi]
MTFEKDPIGFAIHDFYKNGSAENIIVESDLCEDDIIPVSHLFRTFDLMPKIEQKALQLSKGRVLDIGAATGCHSTWLIENKKDVLAVDISNGAVEYMLSKDVNAKQISFLDLKNEKFDTILMLMNGIGLVGNLDKLTPALNHLKTLLNPGGTIICDSTDIKYMYEEEDGSMWVDLNSVYYGEIQFNMKYKEVESGWFDWIYIDPHTLTDYASKSGFDTEIIMEGENNHYLAVLKI